jgi:hypothetical protein
LSYAALKIVNCVPDLVPELEPMRNLILPPQLITESARRALFEAIRPKGYSCGAEEELHTMV